MIDEQLKKILLTANNTIEAIKLNNAQLSTELSEELFTHINELENIGNEAIIEPERRSEINSLTKDISNKLKVINEACTTLSEIHIQSFKRIHNQDLTYDKESIT